MKKIKYILGLIIVTATLSNCDDYDVEPVIDESAKPNVTATVSSASINEAGSPTATITISMDKPIKTTTTFIATQTGGNASAADYEVGGAVIPAYETSATMEIAIMDDILVEGSETLELQISPADVPDIYEVKGTPSVSLSIENSTSDDFVFRMDWDAVYLDAGGGEHHLCDFDLDLEIYDADFNFIGASYSSCPEEIRFSPGDLPDGDYWLIPSFWSSGGTAPPAEPIDIPAVLTFAKPGIVLETVDLTGVWDTATGGYVQNNPDAYLVKYVLTISGSNYTVTDVDTGTVVFEG
ncbi:hypothetical protein [Aestuariivivens sediminis]|uniref:hypothetical protein n=1 Tax=Aestuariivivens sediminis TaxID=2913557 RepID=UPI001F55DDFE|nr:hypothetical protein [Aestuariivivens sediminis]